MPSQRSITLAVGCVAALSAGTNYAFGAYAPQLAARLSLSSTQTNLVGASGNLGVYLSGPIVGVLVDKRGPRAAFILAAAVLGLGYGGIRLIYDGGETGVYASWGLGGLALVELLTGTGSSAGLTAASNGVAKSFSARRRGTAMSFVMASFGLSAFFYSTISHFLGGDDPTSNFLLLLSSLTAICMLVGAYFIRPDPHHSSGAAGYQPIDEGSDSPLVLSRSRSLPTTPVDERPPRIDANGEEEEEESDLVARKEREGLERGVNVTGWTMLRDHDFWIFFAVVGLCSGTGLMFINNLGTFAVTLSPTDKDPREVAALQASLVSLLSIFNCLGRLLSGSVSDHFAHHSPSLRIARVWWLVPMASLFVVSQLLAAATTEAEGWMGLALPTAVTGLAYGCLFGLMAVLMIEWFGIVNFSTNNGLVSLAPAVFGNAANIIFGILYDAHVPTSHLPSDLVTRASLSSRASTSAVDKVCLLRSACFTSAFHLTTAMSCCAVGLAVWLGRRRERTEVDLLPN